MTATLATASDTDVDRLRALDAACYGRPWPRWRWRRILLSPASWVVLSSDAAFLVARDGGDWVDLVRGGVLAGDRRRGRCRELVDLLSPSSVRVRLRETNLAALVAAKSLGFRATRLLRGWSPDGSDGVELWRRPAVETRRRT